MLLADLESAIAEYKHDVVILKELTTALHEKRSVVFHCAGGNGLNFPDCLQEEVNKAIGGVLDREAARLAVFRCELEGETA